MLAPEVIFPEDTNEVYVPNAVILGCAAVVTVAAVVAKTALDTLPTIVPIKFAAITLPVTVKFDNVPTDLILGCASAVTTTAESTDALTLAKLASS